MKASSPRQAGILHCVLNLPLSDALLVIRNRAKPTDTLNDELVESRQRGLHSKKLLMQVERSEIPLAGARPSTLLRTLRFSKGLSNGRWIFYEDVKILNGFFIRFYLQLFFE
jgi:hypothetical protein